LKRLEIRDNISAVLIKRHMDGASIVSPAMQEVIKEEKNQGFKRQNYYYKNRNYRRNSFNGFPHGFNSSTYQLAQSIQKLSNNNQFFPTGEGITGEFPPIPKQLPAYIPKKLMWKRKQLWLP
jgi:predicted alpha/beta-hydrolase family hydrolase